MGAQSLINNNKSIINNKKKTFILLENEIVKMRTVHQDN